MHSRRRAVALAALASAMLPASARASDAEVELPAVRDLRDLAGQIRRTGQPALLLFSTPGCAYCAEVRRGYLRPRLAAAAASGPLIREISIVGRTRIIDLDGAAISGAALAQRFGIRAVPVVHLVDDRMTPLVEPLIGLNAAFYESYLDERIVEARARLRR
jgi:thioredoxin-related protein